MSGGDTQAQRHSLWPRADLRTSLVCLGHDVSTRGLIIRCWRHGARVTRHENTAGHQIMTDTELWLCGKVVGSEKMTGIP